MGMKDKARQGRGDYAEGWAPEPGDEVYGIVVSLSERTAKMRGNDVTYPIVTIATVDVDDDGGAVSYTGDLLAIHCICKALRDDLAAVAKVGDYVYSEFVGMVATQNGNTFNKYASAVASPESDDFPSNLGEPPAGPTDTPVDSAPKDEPF
jgi:hypothetical protein